MLGTIVNTGAIIIGTTGGCIVKKGINDNHQEALFNAMGFAAVALGINAIVTHMYKSNYPVLFIVSLAIGSLAGSILNIDDRFQKLIGKYSNSNLGQGLSTAILLYCIGTLSILGPVMSAIYGDNTYLYTNAALDLVTSMVFGSIYGVGMLLAAPILLLWQGGIYLVAHYLSDSFFSEALIRELSIVGGVLIAGSGISILKIKDCKTLNMLPALLVPVVFFIIKRFIIMPL